MPKFEGKLRKTNVKRNFSFLNFDFRKFGRRVNPDSPLVTPERSPGHVF